MSYFKYQDQDLLFHYSEDSHPDQSKFRMHSHEQCELYYFLSGKGCFHIEGNVYPLKPGDILVMREDESHYIELDCSVPYIRAAFHFTPELTALIDPAGKLTAPFYDREPGTDNLYHADRFPDSRWKSATETILTAENGGRTQLLVGLVSLLWELQRVQGEAAERTIPANPQIYHILRYISEHHTEPLPISQLCRTFAISRSGLCSLFKQATGASVGEYISVKRLSHARALLRSGMPPLRVASLCGFGDYSVFYRAYKKRYGISPRQSE